MTESLRPALPRADVATGLIWPAPTARLTLARLSHLAIDGLAPSLEDEHQFKIGDYTFRTESRLQFPSEEAARSALVSIARRYAQLELLLVPGSLLVCQVSEDDSYWVWTGRPSLEPFEPRLRRARDEASELLIAAYAGALARACRASVRHAFTLEMDVQSFVFGDASLFYAGEILPNEPRENLAARVDAALGHAPVTAEGRALLLHRFQEAMGGATMMPAPALSLGELLDRCREQYE